ncbi:MAG TPA: hypothetical protein VK420_12630, partial [Longimicrobium sp.]|nr:hypothetical protein [Longimicrobium sp.]
VAEVLGAAERLQWLTEPLQRERARELRWTAEEVLATRDGVDVATLELDATDRSVLRLKTRWPVMEALSRKGLGAGLERRVRADVSGAAALGLLTVDGTGPEAFFRGGRALERVWLAATGRGLAVLPYPLPWLAATDAPGSSPGDVAPLRALMPACLEAFGVAPGRTAVGLLRFAQAPAPSARSLRRSVDAVLRFD